MRIENFGYLGPMFGCFAAQDDRSLLFLQAEDAVRNIPILYEESDDDRRQIIYNAPSKNSDITIIVLQLTNFKSLVRGIR